MNRIQYDQLLVSCLHYNEELYSTSFEYKSIFLSLIQPDPTNGRFLPSILINDEHAKQFCSRKITKKQLIEIYDGENHVLVGKHCIINCLKHGSDDWNKASKTIESIIDLGENISMSEMIQVPTIYPIEHDRYQLLTGHRRFFALVYAKGYGSAAQFKIYDKQPIFVKIKQFQENSSREDLPQYGKLMAFSNALIEVEALNNAKIRTGEKKLTVKETATALGISMGAYDNYNVLTRYAAVQRAYESGLSFSFVKVKKIVLSVESQYKLENNITSLRSSDRKTISETIYAQLTNKRDDLAHTQPKHDFRIKPIHSASALKKLLTNNVMELDIDIDWSSIDWQDHSSVSKALNTIVNYLNSEE